MFHDKNIFMQIMICLRKMIMVSQLRHDLFNTANITLSNQTHNSARTLWWGRGGGGGKEHFPRENFNFCLSTGLSSMRDRHSYKEYLILPYPTHSTND